MHFKAIFPLLFVFGVANAVVYNLPSGPDVALAQLQSVTDNYQTVCDSASVATSPCDVEPGVYQLVVFDTMWNAESSELVIGEVNTESDSPITLVTQSCMGGPNTRFGCTAFCPADSVATGGACDVSGGFTVTSVAGSTFYRCPTLLRRNDSSVGVTASVYCLSII